MKSNVTKLIENLQLIVRTGQIEFETANRRTESELFEFKDRTFSSSAEFLAWRKEQRKAAIAARRRSIELLATDDVRKAIETMPNWEDKQRILRQCLKCYLGSHDYKFHDGLDKARLRVDEAIEFIDDFHHEFRTAATDIRSILDDPRVQQIIEISNRIEVDLVKSQILLDGKGIDVKSDVADMVSEMLKRHPERVTLASLGITSSRNLSLNDSLENIIDKGDKKTPGWKFDLWKQDA